LIADRLRTLAPDSSERIESLILLWAERDANFVQEIQLRRSDSFRFE
jgi:hypothetical protein